MKEIVNKMTPITITMTLLMIMLIDAPFVVWTHPGVLLLLEVCGKRFNVYNK